MNSLNYFLTILFILTLFDYVMAGYITPCQKNVKDSSTGEKPEADSMCKQLCTNSTSYTCLDSGACVCDKEPTPSMVNGFTFIHCTNWNYVEQSGCRDLCQPTGKNDTRVCWTFFNEHYCTCFNNQNQQQTPPPPKPTLLLNFFSL